jgi:hypothetical protein
MTAKQIVDKFFPAQKFIDALCVVCPCLDEDYDNDGSVEARKDVVRDNRWKGKRVRAHFKGSKVDVKTKAQLVKGVFRKFRKIT